jgi:mannose-6-phosphate isomerase-like protein (cupin superfamily)
MSMKADPPGSRADATRADIASSSAGPAPLLSQFLTRHLNEAPSASTHYGSIKALVTGADAQDCLIDIFEVSDEECALYQGRRSAYYVLTGRGSLTSAGHSAPLRASMVVVVPPYARHVLRREPTSAPGSVLRLIRFSGSNVTKDSTVNIWPDCDPKFGAEGAN